MKRLALLLVLCLGCTPAPLPTPAPQPPTPPYDARLRDGSVIFWRNGPLLRPILRNTDSDLTHAAIILYQDGKPWVYEAVPPRVHKVLLAEYRKHMESMLREHPRMTWFIVQPIEVYPKWDLMAMKIYAESQLGRRYMIRGWWKEHEVRGIFCSQFIGDTVEKSGEIKSANYHESPGSLYGKLTPFYSKPEIQ